MKIQVVVGLQFGSEAKGHVTHRLVKRAADKGEPVVNIRVGGPNAGHTVYDHTGAKFALRQVPVGAVEPGTTLVIGPGSEVEVAVLLDEIDRLVSAGHIIAGRLFVDEEATLLEMRHHVQEQVDGLTSRLGSTAKGIGAARVERLSRVKGARIKDHPDVMANLSRFGVAVVDTSLLFDQDDTIIIEGTQGFGLGLHAGFYPFATSGDCRAIDFLAQAGINPWDGRAFNARMEMPNFEVWGVARVYPIRVAGNSGPLHMETTWQELGLPEERTTVTQKVRRVGRWDEKLAAEAVRANGGSPVVRIALTMVDQLDPWVTGTEDLATLYSSARIYAFIGRVETDTDARVEMVTTSPETVVWR